MEFNSKSVSASWDNSDMVMGMLIAFVIGIAVMALIVLLVDDTPDEPPLSDYRKVEACEMILRATFRVPDFMTCLEANGLTLVKK